MSGDGREGRPGSPVTIADREALIRQGRAVRLEKHPGHSPAEWAALRSWEEQKQKADRLESLNSSLKQQTRQLEDTVASTDAYRWKSDVSGFEETLAYKAGVRCDVTGGVYTGYYKACARHGKGIVKFDNGSSYEGEFVDDNYCGKGVEITGIGRYVGDFKENKKHGHGVLYWNDGRRYDGQWKLDLMSGFGVMDWHDGRRYYGTFKDDDFEGEGVFTWQGGRKLDAVFKAGRACDGILTEVDPLLSTFWITNRAAAVLIEHAKILL